MKEILKKRINIFVGLLLFVIIILALFLRFNQLGVIPLSISWDEAAVGYNAFTIANYGKDEWGQSFPIYFKSFLDDKHPIHIYLTAFFVKILGLSDFSVRFPAALFGVFNVMLVFLLGRLMFKSSVVGIVAAFLLAVSPYDIQFSRFNHELNFVLFFFMLGLVLFYYGLRKRHWLVSLSFLSFGICLLTYHSAKIVVPIILIGLVSLYFKSLWEIKKWFVLGLVMLGLIVFLIVLNPALLGLARVNQTSFTDGELEKTQIYQMTQNKTLAKGEIAFNQYFLHFTPEYLFISGDKNPRHSTQAIGGFYWPEIVLFILGIIYLGWKRSKEGVILLLWLVFAPLPSSLVKEAPHAARSLFMLGSLTLLSGLGFKLIFDLIKNYYYKVVIAVIFLVSIGYFFNNYYQNYYTVYPEKYAIEWQYGMRDIVDFVKTHPEYTRVYMTEERHQPYIFFLFYLKQPLNKYLENAILDESETKDYNLIASYSDFTNYQFGNWEKVESMPDQYTLYILTPSEFSGLRHKNDFDIKKLVKYPDGSDAFFLVSKL